MTFNYPVGLSNFFVQDFLNQCNVKYFQGVFPINFIPVSEFAKKQSCFVLNLAHSSMQNGHFVVIFIRESSIYYLDPFGLPISNSIIYELAKKNNKKIYYSNEQIQDFQSVYCGFFCIFFILNITKKHNVKIDFYKNVSDLRKNDKKCFQYLKKFINMK